MKLTDTVKLALQNLARTKFRSFLTILGVVIGISAIVLFVSLGVGLQKITSEQVAGMSSLTTLTISQTPSTSTMEEGPKLDNSAIDEIEKIQNVEKVTPSVNMPANLVSEGTSAGGIVYGIDVENASLEISALSSGYLMKNRTDEAVISSALASAFSSDRNSVIGKNITLRLIKDSEEDSGLASKDLTLKIVGIDNNETTNIVYAPLDKIYEIGQLSKYSAVKVKVKSRKDIDEVKTQIKKIGYQVTTIKDLIDQIDKIFLLVQIILGLVGGIGLLVSSLGIINTMTISFLERTREIGIMKTIGASCRDIKRLFIIESALIGFLGGVAGVGVAVGVGLAFNSILNLAIRASGQHLTVFVTPMKFALLMVVSAILISVFAGIYPTRRAQKLKPIDALRQ